MGAAGGGGSSNYAGGDGGVLGGGGGGGLGAAGGAGGFGAGGGGSATGGAGGGGFLAGGGNGASSPSSVGGGGGGSGLGGAIFVQSGGTLVVVDAAQISGNTALPGAGGSSSDSVDPGYTVPGDGAAMGQDIFVREQGSIVFNLGNTLEISTPIEGDQTHGPGGSGGLQKTGTGTLKLNGANTYSGTTAVDGGTLNLNGSVAGNATVGAAGTLSGDAAISGDLTNAGTLAPGGTIGTISAANLTLAPSSRLKMDVAAAGASDHIVVAGTVQLAGTLELNLGPGAGLPGSYTVLTAPSVTGAFSSVTFTGGAAPSNYSVSYLPAGAPNSVQLTILAPTAVPALNTWLLCALACGLLWMGAPALRRSS